MTELKQLTAKDILAELNSINWVERNGGDFFYFSYSLDKYCEWEKLEIGNEKKENRKFQFEIEENGEDKFLILNSEENAPNYRFKIFPIIIDEVNIQFSMMEIEKGFVMTLVKKPIFQKNFLKK